MNTDLVKDDLCSNLQDKEYRASFAEEHVYTRLAFQIRALREQRKLSQTAFGRQACMDQARVSILEDPNAETRPTLKTLLRVGEAFDIGLDVKFVPFSQIINDSTQTDYADLCVPSFDDELAHMGRKGPQSAYSAKLVAATGTGATTPQPMPNNVMTFPGPMAQVNTATTSGGQIWTR